MIARDIERYNLDYSIEDVVFKLAKRGCVLFAGLALSLSALDIAGVHSFETAASTWTFARANVAALGDAIRSGVHDIALLPNNEQIAVRVPAAAAVKSTRAAAAIDRLADARNRDAIEVAMAPSTSALAPERVPVAPLGVDREQAPLQLASITALPEADARSLLTPASLPASAAIPLDAVPLPRAAPPIPPPSPAERLGLTGKAYAKAERCLANAVYFEARSEPIRGQMAVAQVVLNRVFSGFYPDDVCGVVYQNANRHLACQFTFACDGKSKAINERGAWARANRIAKQTLDGQIYLPEVGKSTHYHASYVHPNWVHEMKRFARFGLHAFYRPYAWGNGAEQPVWGKTTATAKKYDTK